MVSCNNGVIKIDGTGVDIVAEMSWLILKFREFLYESVEKDIADDIFLESMKIGFEDEKVMNQIIDLAKGKSGGNNTKSKYKKGQKFQVEIAEVHTHYTDDGKPYNLYRIKGFNSMVMDDYGLDRLVKLAKEGK